MTDPHLLPNQIDLLVDGDAGFTARPMRAHLAECPDCRARYEEAQRAADALEALPHFTPRLPFADQVMAKVQVIEPWHVALTESALRLIPSRGPLRTVAAVGAGLGALLVSAGALWVALRWDLATWMVSLGFERGREVLLAGVADVAARVIGPEATAALTQGDPRPLVLAGGALVLCLAVAALGLRRLAATARAQREG